MYDEETEQYIGGVEELSGAIADLTKTADHPGGISLFKDAEKTEYKSTYEILRDISDIYDELTDKQQANLLEKLAGKRGAQVAAAILNNFAAVESSLVSMSHSAGNAMNEMSIIEGSIEFKINRLKETAVGVFQNLVKQDSVKAVVDLLTGVLEVIDKITGSLGLLGTAMLGIGIAAFIKNFRHLQVVGIEGATSVSMVTAATHGMSIADTKAALVKTALNKEQLKQVLASHGVAEGELEAAAAEIIDAQSAAVDTAATNTLTTAKFSLTAAIKGLWATLKAHPLLIVTGFVIGLVSAINRLCHASQEASKRADEARDKAIETAEASKDEVKQLDDLIKKYKELAESEKQDPATREQIRNLQYEIVDLVGSQASQLDLVNGKLDEEYEKLLKIKGEQAKNATEDALFAYQAAKNSSDKAVGDKNSFGQSGSVIYSGAITPEERQVLISHGDYYGTPEPGYYDRINNKQSYFYREYLRNSGIRISAIGGGIDNTSQVNIYDDDVANGAIGKANALNELLDEIRSAEQNWSSSDFYKTLYEQYKTYQKYAEEVEKGKQGLIDAATDSVFNSSSNLKNIFGVDSLEDYIEYRNDLIEKVHSNEYIQSAGDITLQDIIPTVDSYLSTSSPLSQYYSEYKENESRNSKLLEIVNTLAGSDLSSAFGATGFLETYEKDSNALKKYFSVNSKQLSGLDMLEKVLGLNLSDQELNVALNLVTTNDFSSFDEFKTAFDEERAKVQEQLEQQQYFNYESALEQYKAALSSPKGFFNNLSIGTQPLNEAYDRLYAAMQATYSTRLNDLWNSEGFADTRKELVKLANTTEGITPDAIIELASKSEDLKAILDQDGMSAAFLANILQVQSLGGDGFSLITEDALKLNTALEGISRRFSEVTDAKSRYDKAMSAGEKDDDFKSVAGALKTLSEQFEAGTVNSNAFWAAAEFLFGKEQLEAWGWSDGIEEICEAMKNVAPVFNDAESAGTGFLEKLNEIAQNGKIIGEDGSIIAEIEKFSDGSYDFNIDGLHLDELAKQMGMSKEAVLACLEALSMWGNVNYYNLDEVLDTIKEIGLSSDSFDGTAVNVSALTDQLITLGYTNKEIYDLLTTLQSVDGVTLLDVNADVDTLTQGLTALGLATSDGVNIQVNADDLSTLLQQLGVTKDEAGNLYTKLSEANNITLTNSQGEVKSLDEALAHLDTLEFREVTNEVDTIAQSAQDATNIVQNLQTTINNLTGKTVVVTVDVQRKGNLLGSFFGYASGTSNAHGGAALTGEEGEELVLSNGRAYFVGTNGPEIVNLNPGDTVYTAEQTKRIKRNGSIIKGSIPAYSGGKPGGSGGHIKPGHGSGGSGSGGNGSGTSGSNSSNNSSNGKSDLEVLDWIEILLKRIERAISKVRKVAESAYKSLRTRLTATGDVISKINHEIAVQQNAYNRYMQQANSVGLSADLAEKVRNGTIDIRKYGSATQELIKDYQNWYEKALECSDAIQDLHEELAKLYTDRFNAIQDDFENQLSMFEHLSNMYNNGIDMLEAQGYMASTEYYQRLRSVELQNIATLQEELERLQQAFSDAMSSGEIEEYSDAWYQMMQAIQQVEEAIAEANIQLVDFDKTIREIEWGYFDYMQDRISQLTTEANFLINLMQNSDLFDDNGGFTNTGWATAGLHGQNYNVYMSQADDYAQQILELNELIANDPNNTELIERREELLELQRQAILAAEDEKQALVDLVKQGIEIQLGALRDLIDEYKNALDSAKDLHDYQKKIAQQTANIASLEKQLSAYSGDTSEEARATIQKLQLQLQNAQDELAETQYERYISDQKKLLDELYSDYEEMLNQRLDNIDYLIQDMIDNINERSDIINQTLLDTTEDVGYTITENMQDIWNGSVDAINGVLSFYGEDFSEHLTVIQEILSVIRSGVQSMIGDSNDIADPSNGGGGSGSAPTTPPSPPDDGQNGNFSVGSSFNAANAPIYKYPGDTSPGHQYYASDPVYVVTKEKNGYIQGRWHRLNSGATGWFKKSDITAFKTGGLVNYTGLAQVDGTPNKPELMLNAEDTQNFLALRDYLQLLATNTHGLFMPYYGATPPQVNSLNMAGRLAAMGNRDVVQNTNVTFGDIRIDHVEDYNDFVTQLRNDPKFERMITAMTLGKLAGNSSLSKYNYNWKK